MKVKKLEELLRKLSPEAEVAVMLITEEDVYNEALLQSLNLTGEQIKEVISAIDDREDNIDTVVEYYISLVRDGTLEVE